MKALALLIAVPCLLVSAVQAPAEAASPYPSRTVRLIVPAGAGGAADLVARTLSEPLSAALGQSIIVDNRPGAGGIIGSDAVAKAAADGHTLLVTSNTFIIAPGVFARIPFDIHRDFAPVGLIASTPNVLVAHPSMGVKDMAALVALAKRTAGGIDYGSPAVGSMAHLTMEMVGRSLRIPLAHVPFKGPQQAVLETLAGRVPLTISGVSNGLPHMRSGRLVPLAVTDVRRTPLLPDVPTLAEAGMPDFRLSLWFGMLTTGGTPPAVVERLNRELNAALSAAATRDSLVQRGYSPLGGSTAAFVAKMKDEQPVYFQAIEQAGIRAK